MIQVVNRPVTDQSDVSLESSVQLLQSAFPDTSQDVLKAVLTRYQLRDCIDHIKSTSVRCISDFH